MGWEKVKEYLTGQGYGDRHMLHEQSCATVPLAAKAVGCEEAQIAKTMTFLLEDKPIAIVCAGDVKVKNGKYKAQFGKKATMIPFDKVEEYIGHAPGGVCPFALNADVTVYLDESLKRFSEVYPAGGSENSAVRLTIEELAKLSGMKEWVDVCDK